MAEKNKKQFQQELFGDVEFAAEVIRKLKKAQPNEPIDLGVRIGLDAYAFERGKMPKEQFKERLLKYKYIDKIEGYRTERGTRVRKATYDPNKDLVRVTKGAAQFEREPTQGPPKKGYEHTDEYTRTTRTEEEGKFRSAIHEFRHRGNLLLNRLQYDLDETGLFSGIFSNPRNVDRHADTDYDDIQMNKALNIRADLPEDEKKIEKASKKGSEKRKKTMRKIYNKNKILQDTYPGAYNRGGKVYSNTQSRKVRI